MSTREYAQSLLDRVPENKLLYIVSCLQNVVSPDETPNAESIEAFREIDDMIKNGTGQHFSGSTADFFDMLLAEG